MENHYLILTAGVVLGLIVAILTLYLYSNAYKHDHEKSHLSTERIDYIRSGGFAGNWPKH